MIDHPIRTAPRGTLDFIHKACIIVPASLTKAPKNSVYGRKNMRKSKNTFACFLTVIAFCGFCALIVCYTTTAQEEPLTGQHQYSFGGTDYLLFLPDEYNEKADVEWPMILYLHGAGAGTIEVLRTREALPNKVENEPEFPFIVLSPLFTGNVESDLLDAAFDLLADRSVNYDLINPILEDTINLMDEISAAYRANIYRIYMAGSSLGGFMSWLVAAEYPYRFAAIAPVAGTGDPESACLVKHIPAWAFAGEIDQTVVLDEVKEMNEAVEACGGNPKLTVYPGLGHDTPVFENTFSNPELYDWFMSYMLIDGVPTGVQRQGKLSTTWGSLKQR